MFSRLKDLIQGKRAIGQRRSKDWPKVRKAHLVKFPNCAVCGGSKKLEVHHVSPFHLSPELELDPSNLITACESKKRGINCHLGMAHLGSYKKINPEIRTDAVIWNNKLNAKT